MNKFELVRLVTKKIETHTGVIGNQGCDTIDEKALSRVNCEMDLARALVLDEIRAIMDSVVLRSILRKRPATQLTRRELNSLAEQLMLRARAEQGFAMDALFPAISRTLMAIAEALGPEQVRDASGDVAAAGPQNGKPVKGVEPPQQLTEDEDEEPNEDETDGDLPTDEDPLKDLGRL